MPVITFRCWINLFVQVDGFTLICIVTTLFLLALILTTAVTLTYKMVTNTVTKKRDKKYIVSLVITPYCAFIALFMLLIQLIFYVHDIFPYSNVNYSKICPNINFKHVYVAINPYFVLSCSFGYASFINAYFQRLSIIFDESMFSVEKIHYVLFYVYLAINFIVAICSFIWLVFVQFSTTISPISVSIFQLTYLLETYHICHVLKAKLISFIKLIQITTYNNDKSLGKETIEMVASTKRLTILSYVTLISTLVATISNIILAILVKNARITTILLLLFAALDAFINTCCVVLQFPFTNAIYYKTCKFCTKFKFFNKIDQEIVNGL